MAKKKTVSRKSVDKLTGFDLWWSKTGRMYDPDIEDVAWYDKRKKLAELAYAAGEKANAKVTVLIRPKFTYRLKHEFTKGRERMGVVTSRHAVHKYLRMFVHRPTVEVEVLDGTTVVGSYVSEGCLYGFGEKEMKKEPLPYTLEEVREKFLNNVHGLARYWNGPLSTPRTQLERLEGLAFSMLVLLDGGTDMPGMILLPNPHPDDKAFLIAEGSRYYTPIEGLPPHLEALDIAGALHEQWCKK